MHCFICNGSHCARECPTRKKLSTFICGDEEGQLEKCLDCLSAMKAKVENLKKGLILVKVEVAGNRLNSLVDTEASDLFIADIIAIKIGLKMEKDATRLKIVNSLRLSL